MKLIPATPTNLFIGCKIHKNKVVYYVYKINETTVWAGLAEAEEVLSSIRKKLVKFSAKMENIQAKKLNYVDLFVDEEDANKVKAVVPGEETNKKFLKNCCEAQVLKWKKTIDKKKFGWKNSFVCESCGKQINFVKMEGENVMFSVDYKLFWYNLSTGKYVFFREIGVV
jgi:uncharacterized protein YbcV (DUF1398 family)